MGEIAEAYWRDITMAHPTCNSHQLDMWARERDRIAELEDAPLRIDATGDGCVIQYDNDGTRRALPSLTERLVAAEARAERAERDCATLQAPSFVGRRAVLMYSPEGDVPLKPHDGFGRVEHDGISVLVENRGYCPRMLSVAVFELDDTALDTLERRATELIAAGEALLAEYGKRKAAEEAATSEVLR